MLSFELLSINLYIDLLNYLHLGCSLERLKIIKPRLLNNMGKSKKHEHKIPRGK